MGRLVPMNASVAAGNEIDVSLEEEDEQNGMNGALDVDVEDNADAEYVDEADESDRMDAPVLLANGLDNLCRCFCSSFMERLALDNTSTTSSPRSSSTMLRTIPPPAGASRTDQPSSEAVGEKLYGRRGKKDSAMAIESVEPALDGDGYMYASCAI